MQRVRTNSVQDSSEVIGRLESARTKSRRRLDQWRRVKIWGREEEWQQRGESGQE
jgi:hypothetical protein